MKRAAAWIGAAAAGIAIAGASGVVSPPMTTWLWIGWAVAAAAGAAWAAKPKTKPQRRPTLERINEDHKQ